MHPFSRRCRPAEGDGDRSADRFFDRDGPRGFGHGFDFGRSRGPGFGFGFPGGPGRGGPLGAGGFGPGRKLGANDLQLLILLLLSERARHGYELIKEFDDRSRGYYVPSPGMIYPALSYLEELGHTSVEADGAKKLYTVTVAGLGHLDEHRAAAESMLEQLGWIGERMERMREAMADEEADGPQGPFFGRRGGRRAGGPLGTALQALRTALRAQAADASAEEQQRIAAILERAANEIARRGDQPA